MEKKVNMYWTLFTSTFILSAFTFGGGYVIVPLMEKKFVKELKWLDEEEMLNLVAIGQSSPGPVAVNASILVGYQVGGLIGSFISTIGTVLPPLLIITIISFFYNEFRQNETISVLLNGMQVGVSAVIVSVIFDMVSNILKLKQFLPLILMVASLIAILLLNINIIIVLLISGVAGGFWSLYTLKTKGAD